MFSNSVGAFGHGSLNSVITTGTAIGQHTSPFGYDYNHEDDDNDDYYDDDDNDDYYNYDDNDDDLKQSINQSLLLLL